MRLAALYDVHGNMSALQAVMAIIRDLDPELVVVGGDIIIGPESKECLDYLFSLDLPVKFLLGNCEIYVLNYHKRRSLPSLPEKVLQEVRWTAQSLNPIHFQVMEQWPHSISVDTYKYGNILFCHATPQNAFDIFTERTNEKELEPVFASVSENTIICGHTHMVFKRNIGNKIVINPGSVGMPFDNPGAHWLWIDDDLYFNTTQYDVEKAAEILKKSNYPYIASFIDNYILNIPDKETMLQFLSQNEMESMKEH